MALRLVSFYGLPFSRVYFQGAHCKNLEILSALLVGSTVF